MWAWLLLLAVDVSCGFRLGGSWTIVNIMLVPIIVLWNLLEISVGRTQFFADRSHGLTKDAREVSQAIVATELAANVVHVLHRFVFYGLIIYTVVVVVLAILHA